MFTDAGTDKTSVGGFVKKLPDMINYDKSAPAYPIVATKRK